MGGFELSLWLHRPICVRGLLGGPSTTSVSEDEGTGVRSHLPDSPRRPFAITVPHTDVRVGPTVRVLGGHVTHPPSPAPFAPWPSSRSSRVQVHRIVPGPSSVSPSTTSNRTPRLLGVLKTGFRRRIYSFTGVTTLRSLGLDGRPLLSSGALPGVA